MRGLTRQAWAALAVVLVLGAGCGDDDTAERSASEAMADPAGGDGGDVEALDGGEDGDALGCPLSAERVGAILGTGVEKAEATCSYAPGGVVGEVPSVGFLEQLPELCESGFPEANGYTEPVEGLGVDAFLKEGGMATAELWVCGGVDFVVYIDTGDSDVEAATTHLKALAVEALASV